MEREQKKIITKPIVAPLVEVKPVVAPARLGKTVSKFVGKDIRMCLKKEKTRRRRS